MINKIKHLLNTNEQRFVMIGGLQGAGKSTIVKEFEAVGYKVVCPDRLRVEFAQKVEGNENKLEGELVGILENFSRQAWAIAPTLIKKYLAEGHSVIFDATNSTIKRRKQVLQWARDNKKPLIAVYVECPLEIALERNLKRAETITGTNVKGEPVYGRYVPGHVIELKALSQVLPTKTEGFFETYILHVEAKKNYAYGKMFLEKLQQSKDLEKNLTDLYQEGTLEQLLPTFTKCWNVDQENKNHKLPLHLHMIEAAKYLKNKSFTLFVAGLLHDVGKYTTKKKYAKFLVDTEMFKQGEKVEVKSVGKAGEGFLSARKIDYKGERQELTSIAHVELDPNAHFYEHHTVGAIIARRELYQIGLEEDLLDEIYGYILYHMDLPFKEQSKKSILKLIDKVGIKNVQAMVKLREADKTASGTGEVYFDTIHNETVKIINEVIKEKGWQ
jgi:predicted kinase